MMNNKILVIRLPIKVVTESNTGGHWRPKAKRAKEQRGLLCTAVNANVNPPLPVTVTLCRYAPRPLDGHDNLSSSFKHCIDGIQDAYKVDDSDPRFTWNYIQGHRPYPSIEIRIESI